MSELRKNFEELDFTDDFMFGKVMEDPDLCRDVLECLLQQPVGELAEVHTQREIQCTSDGKPIRLDVYNEDSEGTVYDAEMQNLNKKSIEYHQLPKRSRFYQAAIDNDYMNKGNSFKRLPDSRVLFICTFDPFKRGLPQYTFTEKCKEDPELELGDGTIKVFYNCCYKGDEIPEDVRKLYDYIKNGFVDGELTKRIDEAVNKGRKNELWRSQYMKELTVIMDAIEDEREEKEKALKRAEKAEAEIVKLKKEIERLKTVPKA